MNNTVNRALIEAMKKLNFKSIILTLTLLLTLGVGQMWAADASSARIYFDNTNSNWSNYVQLVGGHGSWSSGTALSKITNTNNLWTNTWSWGGYTYFMFINASGSWGGEGKEAWDRKGSYAHTSTINDNVGSNTYLYVPNSGNNSGFATSGKLSGGYSDLNYTQTINQKLTTNGGSSYSLSTAALASTVRVSSFYLSAASTASSTGNKDISSGSSSNSCKAARTATVTYTVSGVTTGYHFVGWYDGDTEKSTSSTYTYQATGTKTITARFTQNFTAGDVLYMLRNTTWKNASGLNHYAAYFYGSGGNTWVNCTRVGTSDYYSVTVPDGNWKCVIFVAMNKAANSWDNKIYQTDDLMYDASHNGVEITGSNNSQSRITVYTGISVSRTPTAGANAPTITNSQTVVKSGSSVTINAQTENTGYHWVNWTKTSGTLGNANNKSTTFTPSANSASAVANYAANTYTVTYNANDAQYPGTATGSTSSSSHTYGTAKALTSNGFSRTGYIFAGWATSPTGDVEYTNGQSVTNLSSTQGATVTLYAKWTAITLSATISPSTIDANKATSIRFTITTNAPLSSGYYFEITNWGGKNSGTAGGYNIDGDRQITSASPFTYDLAAAKTNLDAGTYKIKLKITKDAVTQVESDLLTLTVSSSTYTVTVGVSPAGYGTVSPTSISASPDSWSGDITATPNAGYRFVNWTSSGGGITINGNTSNPTQVKATSTGGTLTANFAAATYRVTLDNQSATTAGTEYVDATYNTTTLTTITKPTKTNYTFGGYYTATGGGGTQIIDANGNWLASKSGFTDGGRKSIITENKILYAKWTETKYTVNVALSDASQSDGTTEPNGNVQVGAITPVTITAPMPKTGYRSTGRWTTTGGVTVANETANSTTITATSAGTVRWTFDEDLSSPWIVAGGNKIVTTGTTWRTTADANNTMLKKTGHSTESVVYFTVPVTTVCSGDHNENFQFKIYNTSTSKWYGLFASGSYYLLKAEDGTEKSLVEDNQNIELRAYVTGDYEFKLDYSTSTPKLTVTWPVYNQVRISAASPSDATNTGNYDLSDPVSNVRSATRSLNANTTYTFKIMYNSDWYGFNSGTFTRSTSTSSNSRTISTSGGDMTLTTDYAGDYTFKFNESTKALSVEFPTAYKITFGKGSVNGTSGSFSAVNLDNGNSAVTSNSTWVKSGNRVKITAPSAKSGYRFLGWYDNNSATGDAITTLANCTITVNTTKTVYACYAENLTAITITTDGHGTITTPSPNASPYSLGVTTGQAINASASTGYHWNTWTVSGTAALGTTATIASNTAKGNGTNGSTGTVTATFSPNTYSVKFNGNGNTSGSMSNQAFTYDVAQNLTSNAFVKTGYNFAGWATAADGSVVYSNGQSVSNLTSTNGATYNLYAKWTPKQSALTLDYQTSATGYGSSGSISNTSGLKGTYDAAMTALTGTMPSGANGYAFMGFYDETGGGGTKYYNADGSSAHNWDKDTESGTTLYAYYKKAEIAAITFDNAVVESKGTVSFAVTVSPTPTGTTKLCFTVLHSNDNPLAEQPTVSYNGGTGKYSFTAPEASGTYKIEAVLRTGTSCDGGTELDTEVANFQVAGIHTVTVRYKCGDDVIKAATTVTGRPLDWSDAITAPEIFGYTFSGWTTGDGVTLTDDNGTTTKVSTTEATIRIKAIYDGTLIASYAQKKLIYFKNTLGWSDVYVNFHTANAWNNTDNGSGSPKGVGNSGLTNRNKHMIQIGESDIYYYDYGEESIEPSLYISFTNKSRDGVSEFWAENPGIDVVYPANYPDAISTDKSSENGFKAATPMFVPLESQEAKPINVGGSGKANYYNAGYWTKYTPGTGYTLEIYNSAGNVLLKSVEFTSEDELMPMKAVVDLEAGQTYKYQLRRGGTDSYGIYYGNSGTMTYANHGSPTPWDMSNGSFSMCGITTNAAGDYTFNLSYSGHAAVNPHYRLRMAVDYPIASGDYRVIYKDNVKSYWKPSAIVPKVDNGKDIVSFFIRPGSTPYMKIQQATVAGDGAITWNDYYSVPTKTLTALTKDSVYNVCIAMNGSGGASVEKIEAYTGNYYIRVDAANSKWDNYRSDPDHLMTYSEYSITHGGYSHYYCHWVDKNDAGRKNVKFCIANDYSPCISDTLTRETASGDWTNITYYIESNGDLKRNANVRFMWNRHDNTISRAYVDGAQEDGSRFLVISSTDGKIKKADGSSLSNNEVTFSDNENWIYEANVKAQPEAAYKLISTWGETNKITQYFKGSSSSTEKLIGGSGEDWYDIRLLYDFKTNRLIASFVPTDQNITSENAIEADIMFIREHQGDIAQLTFGESGKISKINTAYGVIRFNKWTLANKEKTGGHAVLGSPASIYERSLFWISFPFRVKLSEVFGFGTYGEHWAIQRYDGEARAQKGHFQENGSFWRWMNRNTEYLEPNQGYLLAIDLDLLDENSDVWGPNSRSEQIELFFPSYGTMPDITNANVVQEIPGHECTINWAATQGLPDTGDPRTSYNRTIFDSHWNVMSVPTYVNTDDVSFANTTWTGDHPSFLYTWNADDNTITATSASGYTYHAMHAYMAQYAGGITWTASSGSPASIVARKTYAEQPKEVEFRLELQQNEKEIDRTFVVLSNDEEVSADFQFGEDLTKEFNASKASIYTFIPNVATVAGNTLPMTNQTTTVPVGVDIKANGDYTFAMPEGTSGIGVTLIDNETGVRTNLGLMDYTVTLTAGTYDQRFTLEIPAISSTPTGVEEVTGDGLPVTGARKVLIDNKLYIIKGDKVYDARGAKVQ